MFSPDADISPYHPRPKSSAVENDPRSVSYTSTRLPEYEHRSGDSGSVSAPPSPTRSRIDAAITGTPCMFSIYDSFYVPMLTDSKTIPDHLRSEILDSFRIFHRLHRLN